MTITAAFVLFAVTWFMVFFVVLPLRLVTQGDAGETLPGTHASAPADFRLGRKVKITTMWAVPIWAALSAFILWGGVTVRDIDVFGRMAPLSPAPVTAAE
ncbi:putative secreted protein [Limimaricola variabilis]|uniref:Secreted protein n=1 Tax=Limimaricola variabilis TaxID=1492771 RepID=A0ABR6HPC9_9RHOB|nr:DUF1467 family protein [Limimaricola variabilis]MBB3712420.1 putative secreted protein [Limimaricola variabilis]WPY94138.1 DUF1467 family protein [Limimaricola variabilis]